MTGFFRNSVWASSNECQRFCGQSHLFTKRPVLVLVYEQVAGESLGNAVLKMSLQELIARTRRYSGVSETRVVSILDYLTYGHQGQSKPDPALQPLIELNAQTIALAPTLICGSSLEEKLCGASKPRSRRQEDVLAIERLQSQTLMRSAFLAQITRLALKSWFGVLKAWEDCGEIDLALVDRIERVLYL